MYTTETWLLMMALSYLLTVSIELPVLLIGLSARHRFPTRLFAGLWLTACTYPIVWLVLPSLLEERFWYLLVAETFAPAAECLLFWYAIAGKSPGTRRDTIQDMVSIVVANLMSFGIGELYIKTIGWEWL